MLRGVQNAMSMSALMKALLLVAVTGCLTAVASGAEQPAKTPVDLDRLELQVVDERIHGDFTARPLFEILEAFRALSEFEYRVDKTLIDHPVSGRFQGTSVIIAIKDVLEPFNYTMTFDADGKIQRLYISGLRRTLEGTTAPSVQVPPQCTNCETDFIAAPPEIELSEEIRDAFEVAYLDETPPPELHDLFYPWQDPGTELTGPPLPPGMEFREPPEITPFESENGPLDEDLALMELPEFMPFFSETGPTVDPFIDPGAWPAPVP